MNATSPENEILAGGGVVRNQQHLVERTVGLPCAADFKMTGRGEVLKNLSDPLGREDIGVRQQIWDGFQFRGQRFRRSGILSQAEILQALNRKELAPLSQHTDRVAYLFG